MSNRINGRAVLAAITALALLGALLLVVRTPALAEEQSNDLYPEVWCGTGDTREEAWHWVHNQVPDGVVSATLTARFQILTGPDFLDVIEVQVQGDIGNNIHYDFYYPEGLKLLPTPSDDVDGGKLVLSHWPDCPYQTTTTAGGYTTTTAGGYTTTTAGGYTTTTAGDTTTTAGGYTTTTAGDTTTTAGGYTTTTAGDTTTTAGDTTTTAGDTTTTAGDTTTTAGDTTTTAGDTTTTAGDTTTTAGETTTTEGLENSSTSTSVPDEVSPTVITTTTAPEVLPFTGIDSGSLVMWAALLLVTGLLVLVGVHGTDERDES